MFKSPPRGCALLIIEVATFHTGFCLLFVLYILVLFHCVCVSFYLLAIQETKKSLAGN